MSIKQVPKAWGKEEWIVNNKKYCGKLLHLNKGAWISLHLHPVKQETFYILSGLVYLIVEHNDYCLKTGETVTILPGQKHQFTGMTHAIILEISTHHSDKDVVRFSESRK